MLKRGFAGLAGGLILFGAQFSQAIPIMSIDLDPATAGIQDTLTVDSGTSFTIDLLITGAGETMDSVYFETVYNSSGAVLGLSGGSGSPTAGSLAAPFPVGPGLFGALDLNSFAAVVPGSPLAPPPFPFTPAPGFSGQSGAYGMLLLGGPAVLGEYSLFSLMFDAVTPGISTIAPSAGAFGEGGLSFFGFPVPFMTADATVTVLDPGLPVPEPSSLVLFGLGLMFFRRFAGKRAVPARR